MLCLPFAGQNHFFQRINNKVSDMFTLVQCIDVQTHISLSSSNDLHIPNRAKQTDLALITDFILHLTHRFIGLINISKSGYKKSNYKKSPKEAFIS